MAMSKNTTIALKKDTKQRLDKLGGKGDTYEEIICRLLAFYDMLAVDADRHRNKS